MQSSFLGCGRQDYSGGIALHAEGGSNVQGQNSDRKLCQDLNWEEKHWQ